MKIKYYLLVAVTCVLAACQEDQIPLFEDVNRIQFGNAMTIGSSNDKSLSDSVANFSFIYSSSSVTVDTVYFNVFTSGGPVSYDRYYQLRQVEMEGVVNAEPGVHYMPLNSEEGQGLQLIKAGNATSECGIIVLRDPSLQTEEVSLYFELVPSDEFVLGNPEYIRRKLNITDQLTKPAWWTDMITNFYLLKYSRVKHRFMIDVTGQKWDDEFWTKLRANFSEFNFWRGVLRKELAEYNNLHPDQPLVDEDGDLVVFK